MKYDRAKATNLKDKWKKDLETLQCGSGSELFYAWRDPSAESPPYRVKIGMSRTKKRDLRDRIWDEEYLYVTKVIVLIRTNDARRLEKAVKEMLADSWPGDAPSDEVFEIDSLVAFREQILALWRSQE